MPNRTVQTERLRVFGFEFGAVLDIDTEKRPESGDYVCFLYKGWELIGLLAGEWVLHPQRPVSLYDVQIIGVVLNNTD